MMYVCVLCIFEGVTFNFPYQVSSWFFLGGISSSQYPYFFDGSFLPYQ